MDAREGRWASVHVYLREQQDKFLCSIAAPALDGLQSQGMIDGWFFLRYWTGGPHIRIRARGVSGAEDRVADHMASLFREGLSDWSPAPLPDDFPSEVQPALAALEDAVVVPIRPPLTVERDRYCPETTKYGGASGVRVAEEVFCASTTEVMACLGGSPTPAQRLGRALVDMLRGVRAWGLEEDERSAFFARYAALWSPYVFDSFLDTWVDLWDARSVSVSRVVAAEATEAGGGSLALALHAAGRARDEDPSILQHVTLGGAGLSTTERAAVVASSLLHTHNNRLGLIPEQEAFVGYLLALGTARDGSLDPSRLVSNVSSARSKRLDAVWGTSLI
ncbi:lantibiotic dehydratase C-terminal domain-containing protein [Kocuria sp. CPCC 205297]|uniref:lantibiotic dehydratase C-terminal domain-containing protein n=1 Tax=Kocuria sp. CPCC 205297 TaxID=3073558 RepID=UPI0034D767CE